MDGTQAPRALGMAQPLTPKEAREALEEMGGKIVFEKVWVAHGERRCCVTRPCAAINQSNNDPCA